MKLSLFGIRPTIGRKIYALIGLGFLGLIGVTFLDARELASTLLRQKEIELKHLTDLAISIIKDEQAAVKEGGVTVAEAQKRAQARLTALRYAGNEYFFIVDTQTRLVMHPLRPEMIGRDMSTFTDANGALIYKMFVEAARGGGGFVGYNQNKPGVPTPQPKLSYLASFAPWGWVVGTGVYIDNLEAQTWVSTQRALLAAAIVLLITVVVSMIMARRITKPLHLMTAAMKDIAGGKLDVVVPCIGKNDEIGEMADAVEIFKTNAISRLRLEAEQKELEARTAARRKVDTNKLADDFESAVGQIIETVSSSSTELEASASHADHDRRALAGACDPGGGSVRRSLHQRAVGGLRRRADEHVGQRDQPPGSGVVADCQRSGGSGAQDQ